MSMQMLLMSHRACQNVLPVKTRRRAATSNMKSREAPRTAGGPWSLGQRPAKLRHARVLPWFEGVPPDLYLIREVMDCSDWFPAWQTGIRKIQAVTGSQVSL